MDAPLATNAYRTSHWDSWELRVKDEAKGSDGHEAARLLVAYLRHVEAQEKHAGDGDKKIVLVLPDAEVADRKRKATPPARSAGRTKKRAKSDR